MQESERNAQPVPDEGAVRDLARRLEDAYYNAPECSMRDQWEIVAQVAIAWAERAYGGEAAALRGALEHLRGMFYIDGERAAKAADHADAALTLSSSAAGEAVQRLAVAACNVWDALVVPGLKVNITGPEQAAASAFLNDLLESAKPFLAARGGGRG